MLLCNKVLCLSHLVYGVVEGVRSGDGQGGVCSDSGEVSMSCWQCHGREKESVVIVASECQVSREWQCQFKTSGCCGKWQLIMLCLSDDEVLVGWLGHWLQAAEAGEVCWSVYMMMRMECRW